MESASHQSGAIEARYKVMLEVALDTLRSDPELRLCEGLRLIEATRTAVARHAPDHLGAFEKGVLPQMREALMDRFGMVLCPECDVQ